MWTQFVHLFNRLTTTKRQRFLALLFVPFSITESKKKNRNNQRTVSRLHQRSAIGPISFIFFLFFFNFIFIQYDQNEHRFITPSSSIHPFSSLAYHQISFIEIRLIKTCLFPIHVLSFGRLGEDSNSWDHFYGIIQLVKTYSRLDKFLKYSLIFICFEVARRMTSKLGSCNSKLRSRPYVLVRVVNSSSYINTSYINFYQL